MSTTQMLFFFAAFLMFVDAVGYSVGALRPLHYAFAPNDTYLSRRLLLNLMLANAGLYFTALFTFAGASVGSVSPRAASIIMTVSVLVCLYSAVTIPVLTPKDWQHAILRGFAGFLILVGLTR